MQNPPRTIPGGALERERAAARHARATKAIAGALVSTSGWDGTARRA